MTMFPISTAELTQLRSDAAALLSISCTIKRKVPTNDAYGSQSETRSTVATVNVGLKPPSPAMLDAYVDLIGAKVAWLVKFPYGQDVQQQDHLVIGTDTMVVQSILTQHSYPAYTTVLATEIQQ